MSPIGPSRDKVLYGLLSKRRRPHFYNVVRWAVGIAFTLLIALLPLLGVFRIDLWRGRHLVMGEERTLVEALKDFGFPFLAVNILIVIASRFLGRYLCGFVCPVGSLARLAEWSRWRTRRGERRFLAPLFVLLMCLLLALITASYWVDLTVFSEGSSLAIGLTAGFVLVTAGTLFGIVQFLGLRFCRNWCPSGVYFAVLGHNTLNGIEFVHPETCTDCHACERVCPVDLEPRQMSGGAYRAGGGFYPDGLSNFSHCLRCGDCVVACEGTTAKNEGPTPLRLGWLPEGARDSTNGAPESAVGGTLSGPSGGEIVTAPREAATGAGD